MVTIKMTDANFKELRAFIDEVPTKIGAPLIAFFSNQCKVETVPDDQKQQYEDDHNESDH